MPHGSGGGSHSGGSHHSSHSSHSSHGGGSSGPRISRKPFGNARRFRYYDRQGRERYIYSEVMPRPQSIFQFIFLLIFMIPFIAVGIFLIVSLLCELVLPKMPLTQNYTDTGVYIEDNANLFDDTSELQEILEAFKNKTGIAPYIITVYDSD